MVSPLEVPAIVSTLEELTRSQRNHGRAVFFSRITPSLFVSRRSIFPNINTHRFHNLYSFLQTLHLFLVQSTRCWKLGRSPSPSTMSTKLWSDEKNSWARTSQFKPMRSPRPHETLLRVLVENGNWKHFSEHQLYKNTHFVEKSTYTFYRRKKR